MAEESWVAINEERRYAQIAVGARLVSLGVLPALIFLLAACDGGVGLTWEHPLLRRPPLLAPPTMG